MDIKYPHTIENCVGEKIIFHGVERTPEGDKVLVEAFCLPGCGPAMHLHRLQDEELSVVSGRLGYQFLGEAPKYAAPGEAVLFAKGKAHKFWAEGNEPLHCRGWVRPAHSVVYFLTALYAAMNKSGKNQPETFDGAYLMTRYASEYDMPEIPSFVKKTVIPLTYHVGRLLGKYDHFKDAPAPVKAS